MRPSLSGLNERLATTRDNAAGVIAKRVIERDGLCYFQTSTVSQPSPRAPVPSRRFYRQRCRQEAIFMIPRHSGHLIVLFMRVLAGSTRMLEQKLCADGSQMHIGMVGPVYGGVEVPINRP